MPYPGYPNVTSSSQNFSSDFDQLTAVTSHELAETATDAFPYYGWTETIYQYDSNGNLINTLANEEVCDVPLLLNNWNYQICYCRVGGFLVQKPIAPDGVSVLTPSGSTAPDTIYSSLIAPAVSVINQKLDLLGLDYPFP